jgi:hypothetical protein
MSFAESGFAQFMSSAAGRLVRVIAGLAIIYWGAFDLCLFSLLFGGPLGGARIRALKPKQ